MSEKIDVSIIIPSCNSEVFLKRSVLSCLSQTGVACEVIVVDDAGKDFTRDVLELLQKKNPNIRLTTIYRPSGLGQATARNDGMKIARGKYIALLDSEDAFCSPNTLADWVAEADRQKLDMLISRFYTVSPEMQRHRAGAINLAPGGAYTVARNPELVNVVSCWQILYNRAFLERNRIIFSPNLDQREDRLFVVEALLKANSVGVTDLFTVDHFNVPDPLVKQVDAGRLEQHVQHLLELNSALTAARANGGLNPDFERANAIIYLRQLDAYWGNICCKMLRYDRFKPLVAKYVSELRSMVAHTDALYRDSVLDSGGGDKVIVEGRMDLLRLALQTGHGDILMGILKTRKPSLHQLNVLRRVNDTAEEAVMRALSFLRRVDLNSYDTTSAAPLGDLVKRVILHVGLPKTGSSSLQQYMERNRFRLLEQGFHYPVFGANREESVRRERSPGHASLFQHIANGNTPAVMAQLAADVQDASAVNGTPIDTLILSAENIVSHRFWDQGRLFTRMVGAFDVPQLEIVFVQRHPLSWFASLYTELSGNPWNRFVDTPEEFAHRLSEMGLFDLPGIRHALNAPARVGKLHVGTFEHIRSAGGIETWFCGLTGLDHTDFAPIADHQRNESLAPAKAMLMRLMKRNSALDRQALALASTWIQAGDFGPDLGKSGNITPRMRRGLDHVAKAQASGIAAYEAENGVDPVAPRNPHLPDFETAADLVYTRLAAERDADQGLVPQFLDTLDRCYTGTNGARILQVAREDRAVIAMIAPEAGEEPGPMRIISTAGELETPLLTWDDHDLALVNSDHLERLWQDGIRDVEFEISTNLRNGRRPFRLIRLLTDGSIWPVPPAYADRFTSGDLRGICG
ncbi:MAG: glycosyltransferase [Alphaproteobacteria bacterium]|jgi:hypothetical protein|nr:glycosyltransferase [Alphaproteobacteria bacterium]